MFSLCKQTHFSDKMNCKGHTHLYIIITKFHENIKFLKISRTGVQGMAAASFSGKMSFTKDTLTLCKYCISIILQVHSESAFYFLTALPHSFKSPRCSHRIDI